MAILVDDREQVGGEDEPRVRQFYVEGFTGKTGLEVAALIRDFQQAEFDNDISRAFDMLDAIAERFEQADGFDSPKVITASVGSGDTAIELIRLADSYGIPAIAKRSRDGGFDVMLHPSAPEEVRQVFRRFAAG